MIEGALAKLLPSPGRVLVAPLDWGLGHATRCIPIIDQLLKLGHTPVLAADGAPLSILQESFPELEYIRLPAQKINYPGHAFAEFSVAYQSVRYLFSYHAAERRKVEKLVAQLSIDLIISDNRYGCRSSKVPSVIVTHQIHPKAALPGAGLAASRLVAGLVGRFDACWIPDDDGADNLSGDLSDTSKWSGRRGMSFEFIGIQSRFSETLEKPERFFAGAEPGLLELMNADPFELLMIVSGPNPAADLFAEILKKQALDLKCRALLVEGKPSADLRITEKGRLTMVNHLPAGALGHFLKTTKAIVCRSGYSSLMDLKALGRRALLVATPRQAEQEYLAKRASEMGWHDTVKQQNIALDELLQSNENIGA